LNELEQALIGESAHAAPEIILEGLNGEIVNRRVLDAPHTIYQELWHICFWLQRTLDWVGGLETPYPEDPLDAFPKEADIEREDWDSLCKRFFREVQHAAAISRKTDILDLDVRCPSRPNQPTRTMTVRDQLISLAAHNAYHFGQIVLLRQISGVWSPKSGGFTW
jgi:uncharacterized damage-inducible protein DinB